MSNFNFSFYKLVHDEKFYSNHPHDKGSVTIFGISSKYFPDDFKKIKEISVTGTLNQVLDFAKDFHRREYWDDFLDWLDFALAEKIFSLSVLFGKPRAYQLLQLTLNEYFDEILAVDGVVGNKTFRAVKSHFPDSVRSAFIFRCLEHVRLICDNDWDQLVFLHGWFNRIVSYPCADDLTNYEISFNESMITNKLGGLQ